MKNILLEDYITYFLKSILIKEDKTSEYQRLTKSDVDYAFPPESDENESDENQNYTFGDLQDAINVYINTKGKKEKIKKNKKVGKQATKIALDLIPLVGAAVNTAELVGILMNQDDDQRPKSWLGDFDLDDKTSKIIDNKIEAEFLKHVLDVISRKDKNSLVNDFDMTEELNNYLENNYQRKVVKQ